jgi:hypothetical protein
MSAEAPEHRRPLHLRRISFEGFRRPDGLWDIDGELVDTKTYAFRRREGGEHPAGAPVHHMRVRVTLDDALTVVAIEGGLDSAPYPECRTASGPLHKLVGARLGSGWRSAIDGALGGVNGCTHLRELLFGVATAAFQTIYSYRALGDTNGSAPEMEVTAPPYLNTCSTWNTEGAVVARLMPMFSGKAPVRREATAAARSTGEQDPK